MKNTVMIFLLLGFICTFSACTSYYKVDVDSISTADYYGERVLILSGMDKIEENDMVFQEFKNVVSLALIQSGFQIVTTQDLADQIVYLSYGIGEAQIKELTTPVYGTITQNSPNPSHISIMTTGVTGYKTESYSEYPKFINLKAYEASEIREVENYMLLWLISISNNDESNDLHSAFPLMIASAQPYIGKNTDKMITVEIDENDDRVIIYK